MSARPLSLRVNGRAVAATVEPRQHLADFLRETLLLTGTHLGCEHGVCGACTVAIDGQIARSCITFAVACEGAEVTTIEGFDDDPVMAQLRRAFTEEHGLQCGYCTPGMLIAARDIVTRLPTADERRVRVELSGNLCRCTGYAGIVRAVCRVLAERAAAGQAAAPSVETIAPGAAAPAPPLRPATAGERPRPEAASAQDPGATRIEQSFVLHHPPDVVWRSLQDIALVARCMPGASLSAPVEDGRIRGRIAVKLGPMSASFAGEGTLALDEAGRRGTIEGSGRDKRSATRARGRVVYRLEAAQDGAATRVSVELAYSLAGPLAQFSRGGIVTDLASRLTAAFAENLEAELDAAAGGATARRAQAAEAELDAGGLLARALWARLNALLARILGRA